MLAQVCIFTTFLSMPTHRINKLIYTIDQGEEVLKKISDTLVKGKFLTQKKEGK